jgi:hypothetical protein
MEIWQHNWLPRKGMMRPITFLVPNPPRFLSQLITTARATWDEPLVQSVFLPIDAEAVLSIPLCTRNISDFWAWSGDKRAFFSVKSAYRMIMNTKLTGDNWIDEVEGTSGSEHEGNAWSTLWKVKLPSKIKLFLWRLARSSIPTADVLEHRHMIDSAACMICGALDSWRHTMIDCTMARCIWALADENLVQEMGQYANDNPRDWLFAMNEALTPDMFMHMAVTLWAVWGAKRKAVYEDIHQSPLSTHLFIKSYIADIQLLSKTPTAGGSNRAPRPTHWIGPPANMAKINVDAAVAGRLGVGAIAAIARDTGGSYLGASSIGFRSITDPTTLEALAIRESLALADDLQLQSIQVASDCKVVIDDIKQKSGAAYDAIVHEIIEHSRSFTSCNFVHEFMSSNVEAHNLA